MSQYDLLEKIPLNTFISKKKLHKLFPGMNDSTMSKQLISLTRFGFVKQKVVTRSVRRKRFYPTLHKTQGYYLCRTRVNCYRRIK